MYTIAQGQEYVSQSTGFRAIVDACDGENITYTLVHNCAGCYASVRDFRSHYVLDEERGRGVVQPQSPAAESTDAR